MEGELRIVEEEPYMTVRQVAEVLGVKVNRVQETVRRLFPDCVAHGKETHLDERQVTEVKKTLLANDRTKGGLVKQHVGDVVVPEKQLSVIANSNETYITPLTSTEATEAAAMTGRACLSVDVDRLSLDEQEGITTLAIKIMTTRIDRITRERDSLALELDRAKGWASVKRIVKINNLDEKAARQMWRPLKAWCNENEVERKEVFDQNYGSVWAYPKEAWLSCYPGLKYPKDWKED